MNKFNLTMSVLIAATVVFFGIGIANKANYKAAEGDTVYVTYSIIDGENTYDSQAATVVPGSNDDAIITDDVVLGLKAGADINFDTKLSKKVDIDDETKIKKGTEVTIEGKVSSITPATPVEEVASETVSE